MSPLAVVLALALAAPVARAGDRYLDQLYEGLNDSPMQRKLRALRPFPVGVVFYQQRGQGLPEIRREFEAIKRAGFDSLKQIVLHGEDTAFRQQVENLALDVGLYPWYYGIGGWAPIGPELLRELGIPADTPMAEIEAHPAMRAYQERVLRKRIADAPRIPPMTTFAARGEPGRGHPFIGERLAGPFAEWLQARYGDVAALNDAWNAPWIDGRPFDGFARAARVLVQPRDAHPGGDFRRYRDSLRFQADLAVADYDRLMKHLLSYEPWEPVRTGGHQLLDNQAASGWDLEAQAHAAAQAGSFYSSIHLAHHFREVDGEIDRPVYLQARTIADSFKGGWAAVWESTGGPTMWSGYHSLSVDGPLITRLLLTYVAAGLRGIGIWTWNSRDVGWEAGEYALTDLNGEPSERARAAGRIARALQRHRFELWEARGEPLVGVLYSWENEAVLARMSLGAAPTHRAAHFQRQGSQARIGLTRALQNANLPFELVTERDLRAGLAGRYAVIYMPHVVALPADLLPRLAEYVRTGGRLVADMPLLLYDDYGRRVSTAPGSPFEALFGAVRPDFRDTTDDPQRLGDVRLEGQYAELVPTRARVTTRFAGGAPALLEAPLGAGTAVIVNGELSRMAERPGRRDVEALLVRATLGAHLRAPFRADGVLAHRRSAPHADHYFLVNDGPARTVDVVADRDYRRAEDAITGEAIALRGRGVRVTVPERSARWLRLER